MSKSAVRSEELDSLCLSNIARFKRPREYRFVEALPKNNYGKVLKTELRKAFVSPETRPSRADPSSGRR